MTVVEFTACCVPEDPMLSVPMEGYMVSVTEPPLLKKQGFVSQDPTKGFDEARMYKHTHKHIIP
jgi:hypothetical protein